MLLALFFINILDAGIDIWYGYQEGKEQYATRSLQLVLLLVLLLFMTVWSFLYFLWQWPIGQFFVVLYVVWSMANTIRKRLL